MAVQQISDKIQREGGGVVSSMIVIFFNGTASHRLKTISWKRKRWRLCWKSTLFPCWSSCSLGCSARITKLPSVPTILVYLFPTTSVVSTRFWSLLIGFIWWVFHFWVWDCSIGGSTIRCSSLFRPFSHLLIRCLSSPLLLTRSFSVIRQLFPHG
jgi:hypothetical protein